MWTNQPGFYICLPLYPSNLPVVLKMIVFQKMANETNHPVNDTSDNEEMTEGNNEPK